MFFYHHFWHPNQLFIEKCKVWVIKKIIEVSDLLIPLFLLYRKLRPIKQKTLREDAHEFVWKMYCVPNLARQSVQAHWESVCTHAKTAWRMYGLLSEWAILLKISCIDRIKWAFIMFRQDMLGRYSNLRRKCEWQFLKALV